VAWLSRHGPRRSVGDAAFGERFTRVDRPVKGDL